MMETPDFNNFHLVVFALGQVRSDATLVHGAAPVADSLAAEFWGEIHGRPVEAHPARWEDPCQSECRPGHRRTRYDGKDYCPAAGVRRNQEIIDSGIDQLVVFPGGRGTADMVRRAQRAGVKILDLRSYEQQLANHALSD